MVFKKPRNSRDDKSTRSPKSHSRGDDATKRSSTSSRGKSASADSANSYNPRKKFDNDTPGERKPFSSTGSKPYSGRAKSADDRPKRSFGSDSGDRKPFSSTSRSKPYNGRPTADGDRPKRSFGGEQSADRKPFGSASRSKPYTGRPSDTDRPKRSFEGGEQGADRKPFESRGRSQSFDRPKKSFGNSDSGEKKFNRRPADADGGFKKREGGFKDRPYSKATDTDRPARSADKPASDAPGKTMRSRNPKKVEAKDSGLIRLNRYIANAGICSRRKADELIEAGVVSVNGVVISELGHKVDPMKDEVRYNNETLKREKNVYVLLNKPKDYITTTDDPHERRTVMHLVDKASKERIYPIGRLDRNTTGLLLMTNDGDLADKLSHPRSNITKLYQVELSKNLVQGDLNKIAFGLELEDGLIKPDSVSYVQGGTKREIGIQIHSGKNRIVRRIFEHLGYEVVKLDRVVYAGLTKKDLPRGRWRYLDEKEVIQLKHLI
ncbi:pseudouridine synthase [Mucilaginibacter gynuensis]|uniref:Pseudouridine synthase n=1 Tax=Mucilaginibacter gynuensis TaxID=1302236 RepID=A0ABP8GAD5_9SPHI